MAQMGQSGAHMGPTVDRISSFGAYMSKLWLKLINFGLDGLNFGRNRVNRLKLLKLEL